MYQKTSRIIIPTETWFRTGMKIDRYRLATLLNMACKANQLDNWNNARLDEGDMVFEPRNKYEQELWEAIRDENRKLFQRSLAGKQPRNMNTNKI